MNEKEELINNISKIHTTIMGIDRIKKNLSLDSNDVVLWCKNQILDDASIVYRCGKNYYVNIDNKILTINAYSFTIITAHLKKEK